MTIDASSATFSLLVNRGWGFTASCLIKQMLQFHPCPVRIGNLVFLCHARVTPNKGAGR